MQKHQTIAIIGGGPRGLAVAERLGIELNLQSKKNPVRVLLIDDHEPGAGRIWRRAQSNSFLMNTVAGQVTMYSGPRDNGGDRPGHGPSLCEWMLENSGQDCTAQIEKNTYASRQRYGEYLLDVLKTLRRSYPTPHTLRPLHGMVCDVIPIKDGRYSIEFSDSRSVITVDALVIATGHARGQLESQETIWHQYCQNSSRCDFRTGDSAADLDLEDINNNDTVGIIGMGLGFHDILAALSSGRGGRFESRENGLIYLPSGLEPRIVAGSRSGLPIPARGINQKMGSPSYVPSFFNAHAIEMVRRLSHASRGQRTLSFHEHIEPLIRAEVEHIYFSACIRNRFGNEAAERFKSDHVRIRNPNQKIALSLLKSYDIQDISEINLTALVRPFENITFSNPEDFRYVWRDYLKKDLQEAITGNVDSPIKAALDVLRDVRDTLRSVIEFEGLNEDSLINSFRRNFSPMCALLAAGPPAVRIEQLLALEAAGILSIVGPSVTVDLDITRDHFQISSPQVPGQVHEVTQLIDSRIPTPSLTQSRSLLLQAMMKRGLIKPYKHPDRKGLCDGGIDVLPESFEVVNIKGCANSRIFAIGLPTELPRWFTQVGSATPGTKSRFTLDAQAVANGTLAALSQPYQSMEMLESEGVES